MKISWFNDKKSAVRLYIHTLAWETSIIVGPQEMKIIDVPVPEGHIPWIKEWDNGTVLISWIDESILPSI